MPSIQLRDVYFGTKHLILFVSGYDNTVGMPMFLHILVCTSFTLWFRVYFLHGFNIPFFGFKLFVHYNDILFLVPIIILLWIPYLSF